jgi:hypothetical protein
VVILNKTKNEEIETTLGRYKTKKEERGKKRRKKGKKKDNWENVQEEVREKIILFHYHFRVLNSTESLAKFDPG